MANPLISMEAERKVKIMSVAEIIIGAIMIGAMYILSHLNEWRSNNRISPPGKEMDLKQANIDIATKGKDYYYKQHLAGKYDVDKKKN